MNPYYTDYAEYLRRLFPGQKVQKLSVNGGMTCPNRDGTIGRGGCIYCDNRTFSPGYTAGARSVAGQIEAGRKFFGKKYPEMKYLAYFQSFTNTYGTPSHLRDLYEEALRQEDVVGLVVGTRPDCLPEEVVEILATLARERPVIVELGAESSHDRTLRRINRGHDWRCVTEAVARLTDAGISTGLHLIAGLPGEKREDILATIERVAELPIDSVKIHQMQVIRGTRLHEQYEKGEADIIDWTADDYLDLCVEIIRRVPRRIAIERFVSQAPPGMLVAPSWGLKNYQFTNLLMERLKKIMASQ